MEVKINQTSKQELKQAHQQKIEESRVGGFGGSDARMFYKIGLNGLSALSNTDKMRIRVAKGIDEYKPIMQTDAMQKGHDFEDWWADWFGGAFRGFEREYKVEPDVKMSLNFSVFAHADFYSIEDRRAIELKCVSNIDTVQDDYMAQLQWYYMLGCKGVGLIVCDSKAENFDNGLQGPVKVEKNGNYIKTLLHGIKLLDDNWDDLDLKIGDEWDESDLFPSEQKEVQLMTSYLQQIKSMEAQIEESKAKLLDMMTESGVKSIKSESYNITVVPPGTTSRFDKKKLLSDHPEINEADYTSTSDRKAYLKITLK
jgi:hypothetical protein